MATVVPISEWILPTFSTSRGALYQTDCLNLLDSIRDESIHTVFADPPFNLGKDYGRGAQADELQVGDYLSWCKSWIDECIRVVRPGGAIFIYNLPQWAF